MLYLGNLCGHLNYFEMTSNIFHVNDNLQHRPAVAGLVDAQMLFYIPGMFDDDLFQYKLNPRDIMPIGSCHDVR